MSKKKVFAILISMMLLITLSFGVIAEAKTSDSGPTFRSILRKENKPDGEYWNGNYLYIIKHGVMQFGWVKYKGHTYYCHYTNTKKYPRGSAVRGEMRIRSGNRWYAFGSDGRMITKDQYIRKGRFKKVKCLEIRHGRVIYVYNTSAINRGRRYSTRERRNQWLMPDDTWETIPGHQFYPDYVDFQK